MDINQTVLNVIKKQKNEKKCCDLNNIIIECGNYDLEESQIRSSIDKLLEENILGSRQYKGKMVYRILDSTSEGYTTETDDFIDFKKFVTEQLSNINGKIETLNETTVQRTTMIY